MFENFVEVKYSSLKFQTDHFSWDTLKLCRAFQDVISVQFFQNLQSSCKLNWQLVEKFNVEVDDN